MIFEHATFNPILAFVEMYHDPRNRWFALYMLTSLIAAWLVYLMQARRDPELKSEGFFHFAFPSEIYTHESAKADYVYYVVNKIVFTAFFASMIYFSYVSQEAVFNLLKSFGPGPVLPGCPLLATIVTTLLVVLAADFALWYGHYLSHKIPVLWEFHKVHHSAEVMTPFTAGRVHPIDDMMGYALTGLFSGSVGGVCAYIFGKDASLIAVFQLNIVLFVFYMLAFHLRHSHIWLPLTGWLGHVFISPAHHQVHHSSAERHWDRNMGFVFAIWDWMFGTLHVPADKREDFAFGIGGGEAEYHSWWRMYVVPFKKAARLLGWRANPPALPIPPMSHHKSEV
jgi:sterol desaturase/sphingolipid hydroxylase (fatty acid hydroxylase superfamily)